MSKGEAACGSFLKPGQVELLQLDTSSLALVRNAATEFLQRSNGRLNVLICNAGVMMIPTREQSVDGFEMQLATNYLGHFLLFWLLKDCMLRSSTPEFNSRLVNVSSSGHHESEIQFDDINFEREGGYSPNTAYGQSKLAQIYMTNYVDRHFGPLGLHALSLMPGTIFTNLQKHMPQSAIDGWRQNPDAKKFEKNDEQGAATTVVAAVAREWESQGGEYLENCSVSNTENVVHGLSGVKEYAFDERKEERLWKLTLEILGLDTEQT